jgi:hypothetical protein
VRLEFILTEVGYRVNRVVWKMRLLLKDSLIYT